MSTTTSCPTPEQVEDLLANRLTADEADAIRLHLSTCPLCQAKVNSTSADSGRAAAYPFLSPPRGPNELGWLDDHRILGVLGEGGMSIVFEAEDTQLGRNVALKVLKPRMSDPRTRERFLREGRLLAGLPHEHVVTIYQVGEANGIPYLTMERLEGSSLEERLTRDKWLPLAEALLFTREAAEGLVVAHEEGLVHRDIKPANIWLETRYYRFRRVKLIDFGIARMVNQDSSLTTAGQVLGTPMYMAPEQAQSKPVDGRADLYSLGCVLFHVLTGRPPFAGKAEDTMAVLASAISGETPKVRLEAPQLPPRVAELIQQLLSRDRDQRPPSARALVDRIKQLEGDSPAAPVAPSTLQSASGRRLMRRPGLVGIWLGIITISAALLVGAIQLYHKLLPFSGAGGNGSGAADNTPTGEPLKVGVLHSLTGNLSVHEQHIFKATELAAEEINRSGGVLGRPIQLVIEDGGSDVKMFAEKARKLIEDDKVVVLFGCWSSSSRKRVAEVCRQHDRLLFYSVGCEGLESSPNVVYLGGMPNQTMIPLVRWAYAEKGKRRFFLIGSDEIYSHAIEAILAPEIKRLGGELVGTRYTAMDATNFEADVKELQDKKADLLINTLDGSGNGNLLLALRKAGIRPASVPVVWNSVSEPELSQFRVGEMVGDYSVGCYFESLPRPENKAFVERFRKRFGPRERVNDPMQTAYFGVHLWKKAVEKAEGTDTQAVRQALRGLSVEAPEGLIRLHESNQHAYRTARVGEVVEAEDRAHFEVAYSSPRPLQPEPFPEGRSEKEWKTFLDGLFQKWNGHWERQP